MVWPWNEIHLISAGYWKHLWSLSLLPPESWPLDTSAAMKDCCYFISDHKSMLAGNMKFHCGIQPPLNPLRKESPWTTQEAEGLTRLKENTDTESNPDAWALSQNAHLSLRHSLCLVWEFDTPPPCRQVEGCSFSYVPSWRLGKGLKIWPSVEWPITEVCCLKQKCSVHIASIKEYHYIRIRVRGGKRGI